MTRWMLWTLDQVMRRYCARGHGVVMRACVASTAVVAAPAAPVAVDARHSLATTPPCRRPGRSVCRDSARGHSVRRMACVTTASAVPAAIVTDGTAPAATACVATAPTEPVVFVMAPAAVDVTKNGTAPGASR